MQGVIAMTRGECEPGKAGAMVSPILPSLPQLRWCELLGGSPANRLDQHVLSQSIEL